MRSPALAISSFSSFSRFSRLSRSSRWVSTFAFLCVTSEALACGGKIAPELDDRAPYPPGSPPPPTETRRGADSPTTTTTTTNATLARSAAEACRVLCERDGRCGAWLSDCQEHCVAQIETEACAAIAVRYVQCKADLLDSDFKCAQIDPACEPAYCEYTQCARIAVPPYCP
jgi:hypothetical protein